MNVKKIIGNVIFKFLLHYKLINVKDQKKIHPTVYLNQAFIKGDIQIDENARLIRGVYLSGKIKIGRYTSVNGPNTDIYATKNGVEIGNFCSIARNVSIQEFNHPTNFISTYLISKNVFNKKPQLQSKGPIIIGNDCWIGSHSVILSGVKIGDGAIIAANSVVNKDVPSYAIVGGVPAKVISYRFQKKIIENLIDIKWWNWDISIIKENENLFNNELTMDKLEKLIK